MQLGSWKFTPSLWPSIAVLISFPLLLWLGFWQLDRAAQKEQIAENYEQNYNAPPIELSQLPSEDFDQKKWQWRQINLTGTFESAQQFLLDNQPMHFKTGYFVYTPFKVKNETKRILINRGWVMANPDRQILPDVSITEKTISINGLITSPPSTGIVLSDDLTEKMDHGLIRTQQVNLQNIESLSGSSFFPFIINLDGNSPQGYARNWVIPGSGAEKHYGYAFQWFAMAAALLFIYFFVNLKKVRNDNS